ncbi:hypothetical protein B0H15DRAFT_1019836 [Mycena belliarum]|uniref:Histone H1 n=1 Tax=Mycena belliarum TaxID=1033014 RepID=A0AAD6XQE6_9AGAR|nr:hypothetical protein B0H15DRAFT_1019836 [Mycena belliae]
MQDDAASNPTTSIINPSTTQSPSSSAASTVHYVHNAPPEDHDLKRQYLALLKPQQLIEICLTLDIHVPLALKRNIWPSDFKATIATLQNVVPKVEETPTLIPPQRTEDKSPRPSTEPKPPEKQPTAGPSKQPAPALQPYAFATQPAYPHTPYYQALPPGYAPYSYPYPTPPNGFPPGAYPSAPQAFPPGYPHANHFYAASLHHPESSMPPPHSLTDDTDLPSYEDMIVEGLNAFNDPDGMAPKDLFNWIAGRYPVQSNFRPSASQALQKAFRRGRFKKLPSGKYCLEPTWEGGNSSTRRATRRPQTQGAVPLGVQKPRAMFANGPRVAPVAPHAAPLPPRPVLAPAAQPKPPPPADVSVPAPAVPPNDPYAAAQGILQKINFGALFKLEDGAHVKREAVTLSLAEHTRAELQAQLALLAAQLEEIAQQEEVEEEENDDDMEEVA